MNSPLFNSIKWIVPLFMWGLITESPAAMLYLRTTQTAGNSWDSGNWATTPTGAGSVSAPSSGNSYNTNGLLLRTPLNAAPATFGGDALILDGGGLILKANELTIANLSSTTTGASIQQFGAGVSVIVFNIGQFAVGGTTTILATGTSRGINFDIGTLTGSGNLVIGDAFSNTNYFISATTASAYTGTISLSQSVLNFNNDLVSGGGLDLSGTGVLTLDQNLTFTSLNIGGTALGTGTYSFTYLNTNFDAYFTNGGSGSITVVPEPSASILMAFGIALFFLQRRRFKRTSGRPI